VNNFDTLKKELGEVTLDDLASAAGVPAHDLREAARLTGGRKGVAIIFGADLMRCADSRSTIDALVNLALLTGCLGSDAGGLFPIHEKNNIQGLLDMGITPGQLHGNREGAKRGKDFWEIIEGIEKDNIKALFLAGSDILSFPNNNRIRKALTKLDFLLVQDIFPTESTGLAHIVLPATTAAEKSGTFTTIDNRVQRLGRAVDPPGDARKDWDILADLYSRLAFARHAGTTSEPLNEIMKTIPSYSDSHEFKDERFIAGVKAQYQLRSTGYAFTPVTSSPLSPVAAEFRLLAGPILFHSGTTTTWSENNLKVAPEGYIELFTADASRLGITNGGLVRLTSATGSITGKARVTDRLQPGLLFAPYHFRDLNVNSLLNGSANLVDVKVENG
jgi:formate dehydrogenase alpha subunit